MTVAPSRVISMLCSFYSIFTFPQQLPFHQLYSLLCLIIKTHDLHIEDFLVKLNNAVAVVGHHRLFISLIEDRGVSVGLSEFFLIPDIPCQ